jgi:hypothetical protein
MSTEPDFYRDLKSEDRSKPFGYESVIVCDQQNAHDYEKGTKDPHRVFDHMAVSLQEGKKPVEKQSGCHERDGEAQGIET